MWFVFALITTFSWGVADLFYKKGADRDEKYTHLKTAVMVGFVMGIHAVFTIITKDISYDFVNIFIYLPVSLMYMLSMTVGYYGLRYLELSISSPIQNSSGAVTCIFCIIFLNQLPDKLSAFGILFVCAGVLLLGLLEKKDSDISSADFDKKYKTGLVALSIPVIYCIVDALGTFFDAYYLDDFNSTPLKNVNEENFENVANISYELTFFITAVILLIYILIIKKEKIEINKQKDRAMAAVFETAGQSVYVYAISANGVVAAPLIASYSIVSLILSRIFLKEKLTKQQYVAVTSVMIGILLMGIAEGIGND